MILTSNAFDMYIRGLGLISILCGVVLVFYTLIRSYLINNGLHTKGKVVKCKSYLTRVNDCNAERYKIIVEFYVEGKKYLAKEDGLEEKIQIGVDKDVYYSKFSPAVNSLYRLNPVVGLFGGIFFVVCGVLCFILPYIA